MIITRRYEIDMGHCLAEHEGKCYRPHGHRYVVEATVGGDVIGEGPEAGMVMDFGRLRDAMATTLDPFDHRFVMDATDPRVIDAQQAFGPESVVVVDMAPTAENLAWHWGWQLGRLMPVVEVVVWETPNCRATWRPGPPAPPPPPADRPASGAVSW